MVAIDLRTGAAGIDWYCELQGSGPPVVVIPSGEGDCGSFATTAAPLAERFTVLTFDMPGFSRSSDPPSFDRYSAAQAAGEIASLVRSLELTPAVFYGCSDAPQSSATVTSLSARRRVHSRSAAETTARRRAQPVASKSWRGTSDQSRSSS